MSDFLDSIISHMSYSLFESENAKSYLLSRGSNENQWRRHHLGFLRDRPRVDVELDKQHGDSCESGRGLCDSCRFNKFVESLNPENAYVVYPYFSYSNKCYGFQVRSIIQKEYSTFLIQRRPEAFFFGIHNSLNNIWNSRTVVLTEGPSDCLVVDKFSKYPVLALTTNTINHSQSLFLSRFVDRIILFLDNDKAGIEGKSKIRDLLPTVRCSDVKYPRSTQVKDPADLWKVLGDTKFHSYLQKETENV